MDDRRSPMADESKMTFRIGIIASAVATIIVLVFGALWAHQTDIIELKTNQKMVMSSVARLDALLDTIPEKLAKIEGKIELLQERQNKHRAVSSKNYDLLRSMNGGKR
jgi:hypothetical protein